MMWWTIWWIWGIAAMIFAIIEVALPGYIFMGFAIGAGVTGLLMLIGLGSVVGGTLGTAMLTFAVLSLVAWLVVRRLLGPHAGKTTIIDRDVNEG